MEHTRRVMGSLCRMMPILSLILLTPAWGASSPFELDLKELDRHRPPVVEKREHVRQPAKQPAKPAPRKAAAKHVDIDTARVTRYTVKSGDHIFRILMREFGLSNDEAERLLPTVARLNGLADVRKLSVGQVLLLPTGQPPAKTPSRKHGTAAVKNKPTGKEKRETVQVDVPLASSPVPEPEVQDSSLTEEENLAADVPADVATPSLPLPEAVPETPLPPEEPPIAATVVENLPADTSEPPLPRYPVRMLSISGTNSAEIVDGLTTALGITADKLRIVELKSGAVSGSAFSIKVDRYLEHDGQRVIINCTDKDQFNYTLLRLLEQEGYRVIHAERGDFRTIAESLLTQLKKVHEFTVRQVATGKQEGNKELSGVLVGDGMDDVQLFLHESDRPGDGGR